MVMKLNSSAIMLITGSKQAGEKRTARVTFCNFIFFLTPKYLLLSFVELEMNCMR